MLGSDEYLVMLRQSMSLAFLNLLRSCELSLLPIRLPASDSLILRRSYSDNFDLSRLVYDAQKGSILLFHIVFNLLLSLCAGMPAILN